MIDPAFFPERVNRLRALNALASEPLDEAGEDVRATIALTPWLGSCYTATFPKEILTTQPWLGIHAGAKQPNVNRDGTCRAVAFLSACFRRLNVDHTAGEVDLPP